VKKAGFPEAARADKNDKKLSQKENQSTLGWSPTLAPITNASIGRSLNNNEGK